MREYRVILICRDTDNPNQVNHRIEHKKEISEELFNKIYDIIKDSE